MFDVSRACPFGSKTDDGSARYSAIRWPVELLPISVLATLWHGPYCNVTY